MSCKNMNSAGFFSRRHLIMHFLGRWCFYFDSKFVPKNANLSSLKMGHFLGKKHHYKIHPATLWSCIEYQHYVILIHIHNYIIQPPTWFLAAPCAGCLPGCHQCLPDRRHPGVAVGYWCGRWRCGGWWSPGSPGAGTSCLHLLCSIHGCLGVESSSSSSSSIKFYFQQNTTIKR